MKFEKKMEKDVSELDAITEIYDIPEHFQTKDVVFAFKDFRSGGLLIRWVDDTHALGIFGTKSTAKEALNGFHHSQLKLRCLNEATKQSREKAATHVKSNVSRQSGGGISVLRRYPPQKRINKDNARDTGISKIASGWPHRSAECLASPTTETGAYGYDMSMRSNTSKGNIIVINQRNSNKLAAAEISNGTRNSNTASKQDMTYHKLVELSEMDDNPDGLLLHVGNSKSGFFDLFAKDLNFDTFLHVLKILSIVIKSSQIANLRALLMEINANFIVKIDEKMNNIALKTKAYTEFWQNQTALKQMCIFIVKLMCVFLNTLPSGIGKYNSILRTIEAVISEHNLLGEDLENEIAMCKEMIRGIKEEQNAIYNEQKEKLHSVSSKTNKNQTPPDKFREINIFPNLRDLQENEKPFLRANKMEGKFDCLDTYLDIQFRLLREDYIQSLRHGISEYRRRVAKQESLRNIKNIRIYKSVQILWPVCTTTGIDYCLYFDTAEYMTVNWETSKRLLHGSLLCLSSDNFESIIYATVTNRNVVNLRNGNIQVKLEKDGLLASKSSNVFVMAETTAFFESYRHVLQGLQEMSQDMPFQKYFIECDTSIKPPKYLLDVDGGPIYNMKCLMKNHVDRNTVYPVLDHLVWPSEADVMFDTKQYEAIKSAITRELAIIQGPPGTGKTYIGLKFIELLMQNQSVWKKEGRPSPIMVVCCTNHALDQVLEGVLQFCSSGIVRVGGQCKNVALTKYTLGSIKKTLYDKKMRQRDILQSEIDCKQKLVESESKITKISDALKKTNEGIVGFNVLKAFMTENQIMSFKSKYENQYITKWLGLFNAEVRQESESMKLKCKWELFIVENIKPMAISESSDITCVWDLTLYERAMLYKRWVTVIIEEIERRIKTKRHNNRPWKEIHSMERYYETLNIEIVLANQLLRYASNIPFVKAQILSLKRVVDLNINRAMKAWLALDESNTSNLLIQSALCELTTYNTEESDDVYEKRELMNDDGDETHHSHRMNNLGNTEEETNWITMWKENKKKRYMKTIQMKSTAMTKQTAIEINDVSAISQSCRRNLYKYWLEEYRCQLRSKVKNYEKQYDEATAQLQEIRDMETGDIIKEATIIGLTTTGAAKYRTLLQNVRPKIVIVEEAAEVLESHIITALNKDCQHLILIGDHKQLRPSTTVYELAKKFNLDVSMFERMVRNGIPYVTLSEQHRMRPEISELMRYPNLYPDLQDHVSVTHYDDVKGIEGNILFINHETPEKIGQHSTSFSNPGEAKYTTSLCRYILHQGHSNDHITILTPYIAQVLLLRKEMQTTEFGKVRITTIDNYQGEENEIIILSLVRSLSGQNNIQKNPIGFVGIENRICVALSRAKRGMYVIGNFNLFRQNNNMWQYMVDIMEKKNCINDYLVVRCQNHPHNTTVINTNEDFQKVPEGGCHLPCNTQLPCGHTCPKACHILDKEHTQFKCFENCKNILCESGHACQKRCWQDCGLCEFPVMKKSRVCGHESEMPCHMDPLMHKCVFPCEYTFSCGHKCKKSCGRCKLKFPHQDKCSQLVRKQLQCGHHSDIECSRTIELVVCGKLCNKQLQCSHLCAGKCADCNRDKIHKGCKETCNKVLPCGHSCIFPCSDFCPPCPQKCEWTCSHGIQCSKLCSEECDRCEENCKFKCQHTRCKSRCYEQCQDAKCNMPCKLKLDCGHYCRGLCGEECVCIDCIKTKSDEKSVVEIEKDQLFIMLLDCSCIIEVSRLDHAMKNVLFSRKDLCIRCPKTECNTPIRTNMRRYTNLLKQSRRDISQKYNELHGSNEERLYQTTALRQTMLILRDKGLTSAEFMIIEKRLTPDDKGRLHILEIILDFFTELLQLTEQIKGMPPTLSFSKIAGHQLRQLRKHILNSSPYLKYQYWKEVKQEMNRIRMCINIQKLVSEFDASGLKSTDISEVSKLANGILFENASFSSQKYTSLENIFKELHIILRQNKEVEESSVLSLIMKLKEVK